MAKGTAGPPIANGSWVAWSGGKGRVDLIVANGKVPGVDGDVEGTDKTPAARVVVYENGKATGKKIGMSVAKLRRTPPIRSGKSSGGADALVTRLAAHEEAVEELGLPQHARVSGRAVKAVYDRGLDSWPGEDVTSLTAEEWALGRVDHFIKAAAGGIETKDAAGNDTDMLDPAHPLSDDTDSSDASNDGDESLFAEAGVDDSIPAGAADWSAPPGEADTSADDTAQGATDDQGADQGEAPAATDDESSADDPEDQADGGDDEDTEGKAIVLDKADIDAQLAELLDGAE